MIGRDREGTLLRKALAEGCVVQVIGPPGIGKSTLVRAVLTDPEACWVSLEPVAGPQLEAAVAQALGVPAARDAVQVALEEIRTLVLDGCEGLVQAVAEFVDSICDAVPALCVVITTRFRVRLAPGRCTVVELGPLTEAEGVALFLERARSISLQSVGEAEHGAVQELVRRVGAWPLALELAASRVRLFSPAEMLEEPPLAVLADRSRRGRHGSLEHALEVSWGLLTETDREALSAVALFRAGFDGASFQAVTGGPLEVLERLMDTSFVRWHGSGPARVYRLLSPVREFVLGKRDSLGPGLDARARYGDAVLAATAAAVAEERSSQGALARDRLRRWSADLHDLVEEGGPRAARAALDLAVLARSDGPVGSTLERLNALVTEGLAPDLVEAVARMRADFAIRAFDGVAAQAALEGLEPCAEVLRLRGLGQLRTSELERAIDILREAVELAGDQLGERAEAGLGLGVALLQHGLKAQSRDTLTQALQDVQPLDLPDLEGSIRKFLAIVLRDLGAPAADRLRHIERSVSLHQQTGNLRMEAIARNPLATILLDLLDPRADEEIATLVRLARRTGVQTSVQQGVLYRAIRALDADRVSDAAAILTAVAPPRNAFMALWMSGVSGIVAFQAGAPESAVRQLERAAEGLAGLGLRADALVFECALAVLGARSPPGAVEGLPPGAPLALLIALAQAIRAGKPIPPEVEQGAQEFLEVRLVYRMASTGAAEVDRTGAWFRTAEGRVDLGRRRVLRRLLGALAVAAERGEPVVHSALLEAGWPGQRMTVQSARARLHVAISSLRKAGLREILETVEIDGETGYRLRARVTG